jgi:hypothetical protein
MKNVFKQIGIIALFAIIGFSFSTCDSFDKGKEEDLRITPLAENFNISGTGTFDYDGSPKKVTVTAKNGTTTGAITVKYNGDTTDPSAVGSYTVTFDVAETSTWKAAKDLSAGELIIGTPTPKLAHFNIVGTGTVYFDPTTEAKKVTVTAQTGKTTGAVTVYYESTDKESYPKVDEAPIFFGTYNVTFDVEEATGWNGATGLNAGTLTIADGTPSTPTGVSIAIQSLTSLKVSWTSVDRATSYKVYYITADMDELKLAGTVTTNSFTHSGLTLNVDDIYFYYVIAVSDKYGESDYSDFKSIVIDKPVAPNSVIATASSAKEISLRWSTVSGATLYKVFYNTTNSASGSTEISGTYTSASTSLTGFSANTTYYFWVKAVNPFGESDYSLSGSAKTPMESNYNLGLKASYAPPSSFTDGRQQGSITLSINTISTSNGSIRYYLYRSVGTPDNFQLIYSSQFTMFYTDTYRPSNTTYYYYVTFTYTPFSSSGSIQEYMSEIISYTVGSYTPPAIPPTPPATPPPAASTPPPAASSGQKTCPLCYGDGKCSGHYLIYYCKNGYLDCSKCNGSGKVSNKTCTRCDGKGKEKCGLCNGDGKCRRCNGKGKI